MRIQISRDRTLEVTLEDGRYAHVDYKAGMDVTVKRDWGQQLVDAGEAVEVVPPTSEEAKAKAKG